MAYHPFVTFMITVSTIDLKLKELAYAHINTRFEVLQSIQNSRHPDQNLVLDFIVESMHHLESLALSSAAFYRTDYYKILHRVSSECQHIKHLKLYQIDGQYKDLFTVQKSSG